MEVLIRGREFANQLQFLLQNRDPTSVEDRNLEVYAIELTTKILQSFSVALSLLNSTNPGGATTTTMTNEIFFQNPVITSTLGSPSSDDRKSTGESKKKIDRKVGCKRRKTSHTWVRVTPTPIDDGRAWRKYGQKVIHKNKFPRSYYRCTHKIEQGCEATKQVQKTQSNPSMYQTTYMGHHTCKDTFNVVADLILDEIPSDPNLISFQSNLATKQAYSFSSSMPSSSSLNPNKQEILMKVDDHTTMDNNIDHDLTLSELLADLAEFDEDSSEQQPTSILESTSGSDLGGDVISSDGGMYSCTTSTDHDQSFDFMMSGSGEFDDDGAFYYFE